MKKNILYFLLLFLFTVTTFSQGAVNIDIATERLNMSSEIKKPLKAKGSPYMNKAYLPVKISGFNNQLFPGRYNAFQDEMEIDLGTKIIALNKNEEYKVTYTQKNKSYQIFDYTNYNNVKKRGFLVILKEEKMFSLLKKETIKYHDAVKAASSYQSDKPASFKRASDTYFIKKGESITELPTKKKELLKTYPKDSKVIKSFIKDKKISLKKEADLIKLAEFLATL